MLLLAKLVLMPRPLRLPEKPPGREAAPCPARPSPMAIEAISTKSRRPDGQAAASGPKEARIERALEGPRAGQHRVPQGCRKGEIAGLIR